MNYEVLMDTLSSDGLEIIHIDRPFSFHECFPLGNKVFILDNYLSRNIHQWLDNTWVNETWWAKTNKVRRNGLDDEGKNVQSYHEFWGASILRHQEGCDPKRATYDDESGRSDALSSFGTLWLDRKLRTDFSFEWMRFQYAGLNSQTAGLDGTCHYDTDDGNEWNCSFLWYPNLYWFDYWGGDLNLYSKVKKGATQHDEELKKYRVGSIKFKPNRLIIFDGRIPHQACSPNTNSGYSDRRSIVIRGDEIRTLDKQERYYANY